MKKAFDATIKKHIKGRKNKTEFEREKKQIA